MPCHKQGHSSTKSAAEYWVPAFAGMTPLKPCFVLLCAMAAQGFTEAIFLRGVLFAPLVFFAFPVPGLLALRLMNL
jgi:hypothetical protein